MRLLQNEFFSEGSYQFGPAHFRHHLVNDDEIERWTVRFRLADCLNRIGRPPCDDGLHLQAI